MKSILHSIMCALGLSLLAASCEVSSEVGNTLADETITIVADSAFTVTGNSELNPVVQSRTLTQLIGQVDAPGFGKIYSDFVGQFMPSLTIDTSDVKVNQIDSVKLYMRMLAGQYTGDSIVPMGIDIYRLNRDLPYPIYSNFDPAQYYDPSQKLGSTTMLATSFGQSDSIKKIEGVVAVVPLPLSFATEMFEAYAKNPANFQSPDAFAKNVFKGIYIKSSYGSGRITNFAATSVRVFYHKNVWNEDSARYDLKRYTGDYFATTPEVVVNNNIRYSIDPTLSALAATTPVIVAPVGYEVNFRFPLNEILASYNRYSNKSRVVNALTLSIPAEKITNKYDIAPPTYVLMVLKSKKDEFFAQNKLPDNITSFYAAYDETTGTYSFASMRSYLMEMLEKENISPEDYTFTLTPVQLGFESSTDSYSTTQVLSTVAPYVQKPAMAKINLEKAKIKFTFSAGNK